MKSLIFKGCGTALVTPFKDGKVDYDTYAALVDRQVKGGVDFLVPLGTTAETPCLSKEEKKEIMRITKEHCGGLKLLVGAGSNSLAATLENMEFLEECGADGFLIVVPFYNKPTQNGQYEYFKAVAAATTKPVVVYNVPGRTGVNMESSTALRLAREIPNIVAIKEASGKLTQISEIIAGAPEGFGVLSGDDGITFPILALGGSGVISVASNVVPEMMSRMVSDTLAGNYDAARILHHKLSPLFKNLFIETSPIPAKAAMARLGLMKDELRLPLVAPSEKTYEIIDRTLSDLK